MKYKLQFLHISPNNNFTPLFKYLNTTNIHRIKTRSKVSYTASYWMTKILNLLGPIQFKTIYGESIRITFYLLAEHCMESLPMVC